MHLKDLHLSTAKQRKMIAFHCCSLICHLLKRKKPLHFLSSWTRELYLLWARTVTPLSSITAWNVHTKQGVLGQSKKDETRFLFIEHSWVQSAVSAYDANNDYMPEKSTSFTARRFQDMLLLKWCTPVNVMWTDTKQSWLEVDYCPLIARPLYHGKVLTFTNVCETIYSTIIYISRELLQSQ